MASLHGVNVLPHNTGALPFQFFVHDLRVKQISCTLPFQFFVHDLRVKQISCTHNTGALPFQFFVHDLRVKQISCTHKHRYYTTYLQTCSTGRSTRDYAGVMLGMSLYMHMSTNSSLLLSLTCTAFYVLQ